jgi:uncharacterized membrane protein
MTFHPYAPSPSPAPSQGDYAAGAPEPWEPTEVLGQAWDLFKAHWATLVFAPMVGQMIASGISQAFQVAGGMNARDETAAIAVMAVGGLVSFVASTFFTAGVTKLMIATARGETPSFGDVFSGGPRFLPLLGTQLLVSLVVVLGLLLLVVPGVVMALAFTLAPYYVVDRQLGPIEAMKASWEATEGQKGKLLGYGVIAFFIVVLGLVACCIGSIVGASVSQLGMAIIYVRLSGTGRRPDSFGGPFGGFGGPGFGGPGAGGPGFGGPGFGGPGFGGPGAGWGSTPNGFGGGNAPPPPTAPGFEPPGGFPPGRGPGGMGGLGGPGFGG